MTETFLYSVKPRRPIQLDGSVIIKTPKSLLLTKEDVLTCIDKGAIVYRRFANEDKLEPVTKYNLDRLHNNKFITEDEYAKAEKDELGKNSGTVSIAEPVVESEPAKVEEKVEEPVIAEPEKVEEPVETEAPVVGTPVEEVAEEAPAVEEEVKEEVVTTEETESSEDTSEVSEVESDETVAEVDQVSGSDAVEESESKEDSNNQFKNYKKKKNK